jgi:hypothetical protein
MKDPHREQNPGYYSGILTDLWFFVISGNMFSKFGANRWILSRTISEQTHAHNFSFTCKYKWDLMLAAVKFLASLLACNAIWTCQPCRYRQSRSSETFVHTYKSTRHYIQRDQHIRFYNRWFLRCRCKHSTKPSTLNFLLLLQTTQNLLPFVYLRISCFEVNISSLWANNFSSYELFLCSQPVQIEKTDYSGVFGCYVTKLLRFCETSWTPKHLPRHVS